MNPIKVIILAFLVPIYGCMNSGKSNLYAPDFSKPKQIKGMKLVWNDEFNINGKPDTANWRYEIGFVRNQELQWYQPDNANCSEGRLIIEARRETVKNPGYDPERKNWQSSREYAEYTSASIQTRGFHQWQFGRFEIRARIDTSKGAWPAIWTLGISQRWPACGEIDIMEYYPFRGVPSILANFAWLSEKGRGAKWDDLKKPLADFSAADKDWVNKYHIWRMDWTKDSISLFLDDLLLNSVRISDTVNPDGFNPFLQPHYILLNLAIGSIGGDPTNTEFPVTYEVDYVRVYQDK